MSICVGYSVIGDARFHTSLHVNVTFITKPLYDIRMTPIHNDWNVKGGNLTFQGFMSELGCKTGLFPTAMAKKTAEMHHG